MNKLRYFFLAPALIATGWLSAHNDNATPSDIWTLKDCIKYAAEHNLSIRQKRLEAEKGEINLSSAKAAYLPTVSGTASQTFSFGRSTSQDNVIVDNNASQLNLGVQGEWKLFDGLKRTNRLKTARLSLSQMLLNADATREDVTLNVISAYLQALLASELEQVAKLQVSLSQTEVDRQSTLVAAGKSPELDLVQAKAQLAQDELTLVENTNNHTQALLDLKQLLLIPVEQAFDVAPLEDTAAPLPDADEIYLSAMENNSSILSRRKAIEVAESRIAEAKSGWFPTVTLNAGVGTNYYNMLGKSGNQALGTQLKNNLAENIGVTVSVPIFDAFSTLNSINTAKVDRLMADLDLEQTANTLYKNISLAYSQAVATMKKADAAAIARDATKEAFEAIALKFNYGKANATEYEQAKTNYIEACSKAVQAQYEYMMRIKILEFYNDPYTYVPVTKTD